MSQPKRGRDMASTKRMKQSIIGNEEAAANTPSSQLWNKHESVWHCNYNSIKSDKIAAFDLDGTLITTKSGKRFPEHRDDWKLKYATILSHLQKLHAEKYKIVIFTNQKGISTGSITVANMTAKMDAIQAALRVPLHAFILSADDIFRKPRIGCWLYMQEQGFEDYGVVLNMKACFFVGDSAGRVKRSGASLVRDPSDADLKFALNCKIAFKTPEQFFLDQKEVLSTDFAFTPLSLENCSSKNTLQPLLQWAAAYPKQQEVILLIGPPASGKSTLCNFYFSSYTRVNQDSLKTKSNCMAKYEEAIRAGNSVIIDNQNRDVATRAPYLTVAVKKGILVRTIFLDLSKSLCLHLNTYRMLTNPSAQPVPIVTIHSFFKYVEPPQASEGFSAVLRLTDRSFVAGPFRTQREEELFFSHLN